MRGLFLRRSFAKAESEPTEYTITVTGYGQYAYIRINGTKITEAGTYKIEKGGTIYCYAEANTENMTATIELNGKTVAIANLSFCSYNYTPTADATIDLYSVGGVYMCGKITITEE